MPGTAGPARRRPRCRCLTKRRPAPALTQVHVLPLDDSASCQALTELWRAQLLCDVLVRAGTAGSPGQRCIPAHAVVLASASSYFRALLAGAGLHMRERQAAGGGLAELDLPEIDGAFMMSVLEALYTRRVTVRGREVAQLRCAGRGRRGGEGLFDHVAT